MEALLYFLLWGGLIFLMMRFGCGRHMAAGHSRPTEDRPSSDSASLRWMPPARDTDPVCGKTVRTAGAKPSVHDGQVYYFCSRECRKVFEAAPDLYVDGADTSRQPPAARALEHPHA